MGRHRPPDRAKTRTRGHIIADLAVNRVEREVLRRGCTMQEYVKDYGYDAQVITYNGAGEAEESNLYLQIKGTERVDRLADASMITFRLERADLVRWLREILPVFLVVYDATEDKAYWLYIQNYFETLPGFSLFTMGIRTTVHIPHSQVLTPEAVGHFGDCLRRVVAQVGDIRHD